MKNYKLFIIHWIIITSFQIIVLFLMFLFIGRYLIVEHPLQKADVIHIHGSNDAYRIKHGIELFKKGYAESIIITDYGQFLEASVQKLLRAKIPLEKVIQIDSCMSTYDEVLYINKVKKNYNWNRMIIVTDIYHSRRALNTHQHFLNNIEFISSPVRNSVYQDAKWWKTELGTAMMFSEFIKNVYYLFKYHILPF